MSGPQTGKPVRPYSFRFREMRERPGVAHSGRTAARRICQIGVRGKGVILQRFKDGNLADVRVFKKADGLTWIDSAGRTFTLSWAELRDWIGVRARAGRLAPKGFPRTPSARHSDRRGPGPALM